MPNVWRGFLFSATEFVFCNGGRLLSADKKFCDGGRLFSADKKFCNGGRLLSADKKNAIFIDGG